MKPTTKVQVALAQEEDTGKLTFSVTPETEGLTEQEAMEERMAWQLVFLGIRGSFSGPEGEEFFSQLFAKGVALVEEELPEEE